jgi:aryl-alcohol dehydrogenase-like predicted oxidoreductase
MQYRQLGRTGIFVSRVSLGAMTFGGANSPLWTLVGALPLAESQRLVESALDAGVNFVVSADVYGSGESEEQLGRILQHRRRDVVLATKFAARTGPGPNALGQSRLYLMDALEDSLRRLRTDHIDLYQMHNIDPLTPLEETLGALDDAVRQGKIRYIGCSNYAAWQISTALGVSAKHGWSSFICADAHYSLLSRDVEREIVPMIEHSGLGLTIWSPLVGGLLSGKIDRNGTSDKEARSAHTQFIPIDRARAFDIIDVVKVVAARHGVSAAQVALAWLLAKPAVTSVTVGARRLDQLSDNLAAVELTLADEEIAQLDEISALPPSYPNWIQHPSYLDRFPQSASTTRSST